ARRALLCGAQGVALESWELILEQTPERPPKRLIEEKPLHDTVPEPRHALFRVAFRGVSVIQHADVSLQHAAGLIYVTVVEILKDGVAHGVMGPVAFGVHFSHQSFKLGLSFVA